MIVAVPIYKQEMDGEFINTILAIRIQLTGEESLKELILQCKHTLFDANEHLNYPLERLFKEKDIAFSQKEFSLFETGILLENIHYKNTIYIYCTYKSLFQLKKSF